MPRLEETILKNLIYNSAYARKVFPFLKEEYFTDLHERNVFKEISSFIETYHNPPTYEAMIITITESRTLNEQQVESSIKILEDIHQQKDEPTDPIWLVKETEKFCQDKSIYNAVLEAVAILDDRSEKKSKGAIPELLSKALAVSFDNSVGHDYLLSAEDRWDYYHKKEKKIPFDIELFNLITDGGFSEKTLNIIIAGTGVGKAQPGNIYLPTPKGRRKFSDLMVGDYVFGSDGYPTKVTGIFPQGRKAIYQITFSDGRKTTCCGDHLWKIYDASRKLDNNQFSLHGGWHVKSTNEIIEYLKKPSLKNRLYVPLSKPLQYTRVDLPIDPYLLGVILGDGHITKCGSVALTIGDRNIDILKTVEPLLPKGLSIRKSGITYHITAGNTSPIGWQGSVNPLSKRLRDMGLHGKRSWEKNIPNEYLTASVVDRQRLLRGLMDTDGYVSKTQAMSYTTTSEQLADDVINLVRGLGGVATLSTRYTSYIYRGIKKRGRLSYKIAIRIPRSLEIFSTKSKMERVSDTYQYDDLRLRIDNIEQLSEEDCRCISVEAEDHLYVTENFILTHNTLIMCHIAAAAASLGKNVLYITMEMAEERIAERIDTNLMNISMKDLKNISKSEYDRRIEKLRSQVTGKFIIKEYPTASASVIHFRQLIQELRLKKEFKPDMIIVDYMNICTSSRIKMGGSVNSYTYIKSIAEELRGLGVEFGVPVVSATQTTRGGYDNSDLGLTDTSESFGVPATADFMMAAITTEELEKVNQIMFKQLKNRYEDVTKNRRFVVGIDKSKMKLYNLDPSAQESIQGGITQVKEEKKVLGRLPTKTYGLKV